MKTTFTPLLASLAPISALLVLFTAVPAFAQLPVEPVDIGHEPQLVLDNFIVDNHWAIKYKRQAVQRVAHAAVKASDRPLLTGDDPSYLWVVRDEQAGLFRMYYQANFPVEKAAAKGRAFATYIAYAESKDGLHWQRPELNLFPWFRGKPNNIVVADAARPEYETCAPCLLDVPQRDRKGYRWLMMYRAKGKGGGDVNGIRLVGSQDGIHWDAAGDERIAHLHSDAPNAIVYDPRRQEYVMFCRAKHIYRAWGDQMIDTGASRRIARMASKELWTDWLARTSPQTILTPDEIDNQTHHNFFYGMPTRYYAGLYWGFLEPFRMNDFIHTELVTSSDGVHFQRLPGRPKLIEYGAEGTWDDTMIFASPSWIEVGDQWWIYYTGWDGPHGTRERSGGIGLARIRKEGFVSMRGPQGGGVVCTRLLRWPGGALSVNADASGGELRVRVSDAARKPLAGFDYDDCETFRGDDVAWRPSWKGRSLDELKGREIRLEFFLQSADLYAFRAAE